MPSRWPDIIQKASSFLGAHAAAIGTGYVTDLHSHKVDNSRGIDSDLLDIYNRQYDAHNPWFTVARKTVLEGQKLGHRPIRGDDLISAEVMRKTPVYNESLLPMDLADLIAIPLHVDRSFCALYFFCGTKKGRFEDNDYQNAEKISFHLWNGYRQMSSMLPAWQYLENEDTCRQDCSALMVKQDLTVLDISQVAKNHAGLKRQHGYITAGKYRFAAAHIDQLVKARMRKIIDSELVAGKLMTCLDVNLSLSTRCKVLYFLPGSFRLTRNKRFLRFLLVFETDEALVESVATLANMIGLTKAESEISIMLSMGLTRQIICTQRGISEHTYRFHMKNIRQKTGLRIADFLIFVNGLRILPTHVGISLSTDLERVLS